MNTTEDYEQYANLNAGATEEDRHRTFLRFSSVFLACMYLFACIFGVTGNVLVLVIFIFYQKVKTITDMFLVSLATADLYFLCTLPFWAYSAVHEWIFGTLTCQIIRGLYTLNLYGSMLTLTCITIDRYYAIVEATKAHISQAKRIVCGKAICILIWVLSLVFALPQFIFSTAFKFDKTICYTNYSSAHVQLFTEVIQMSLGFFCPILVMIICYSTITNTLLHARGFQRHKSLKVIFAIVMTFILTQTPHNLLRLIRAADKRVSLDYNFDYAVIVTEAIAYFHGCLNPVLYFFIGAKFRKNLAKIVKNVGCAKHQPITTQYQTTDEDGSKTYTASNNVEETSMHPL